MDCRVSKTLCQHTNTHTRTHAHTHARKYAKREIKEKKPFPGETLDSESEAAEQRVDLGRPVGPEAKGGARDTQSGLRPPTRREPEPGQTGKHSDTPGGCIGPRKLHEFLDIVRKEKTEKKKRILKTPLPLLEVGGASK